MELYTAVSHEISQRITRRYSSSFSLASSRFPRPVRQAIYDIYGLVRIADEVVDSYHGDDSLQILNELEESVEHALHCGYSANPIVHSFAQTARKYAIDRALIAPFFASMRMDITLLSHTPKTYKEYIHGSAEVIGLMCLKVFVEGDSKQYQQLESGAKHLGAAYQKVNFLRDFAEDYQQLGRTYFPGVTFETFDEAKKSAIIADIEKDFDSALPAIRQLPAAARVAVDTSYRYYRELLHELKLTKAEEITRTRVRVPTPRKLRLLVQSIAARGL